MRGKFKIGRKNHASAMAGSAPQRLVAALVMLGRVELFGDTVLNKFSVLCACLVLLILKVALSGVLNLESPHVGGALLIGAKTGHARHLRKRTWGTLHDNYNCAYICMDRILRFCRNVMENLGLKTGIPCPDDKNHGDPRQPGILAQKVQYHIMGRDVSGIFFWDPFPQWFFDLFLYLCL